MKMYKCVGEKTLMNFEIPEEAGVYFFWTEDELIYIGKTKNLRMRIAQHFGRGTMILHMINPEEPTSVSFIQTKDEFDAARIEYNLLKNILPKYNQSPFYESKNYSNWKFGTKDKQENILLKDENEQTTIY